MDPYRYRLRADTVYDEDMNAFIVYGVDAVGVSDKTLLSFPDIFFDRGEAERFVYTCNKGNLSLMHMEDVIEDCLT